MENDYKNAVKYIYGLMDYYNYVDFNSLSKFQIKEEPTTEDAKIIFMVSNMLNKARNNNYEITKQDKLYYRKILNTNKKWQEVEKQKG
jgi:hypothetical protein